MMKNEKKTTTRFHRKVTVQLMMINFVIEGKKNSFFTAEIFNLITCVASYKEIFLIRISYEISKFHNLF